MPETIVIRTQAEQDERERQGRAAGRKFIVFVFKYLIPIGLILFGILMNSMGVNASIFIWIGIIWLIIAIISKIVRFNRRINRKAFQSRDWEQIDRLPNWAYRKMKRRRSNVVNGEHYKYKKEGNKFYRKKRK